MRAKKLTTEKEVKEYIKEVFLRGNGKEIASTLKRYYIWKQKRLDKEFMEEAKKIFGVE